MGVWAIEETDTFGGQANYCWVNRHTVPCIENESNRSAARRIKAAAGYSGIRGQSCWSGDMYEFRPANACIVVFARWTEEA